MEHSFHFHRWCSFCAFVCQVTQHDFVVSGAVRVWTLQKDGSTLRTRYDQHAHIAIPPYTPHLFEFLQDLCLVEWWDGPFAAWYYEPYRSLVQRSMDNDTEW